MKEKVRVAVRNNTERKTGLVTQCVCGTKYIPKGITIEYNHKKTAKWLLI